MNLRLISNPIRRNARQLAAEVRFRFGGRPRLRRRVSTALKTIGGGLAYAALIEPYFVQTTQVEIPVGDLHPALDGYRIAHLTDIHYNFSAGMHFLRRVVEKTNALDPDMVALTGDFITHNGRNLERCLALLSDLRAPDGCWVVRGNHDHRVPLELMERLCREYGLRLVENRHAVVRPARHRMNSPGRGASGEAPMLTVAGVGDLWEGECLPAKALQGARDNRPTILLSHHGQCAELLTGRERVDLILSGHTHGGQIRPMGRSFRMLSSGSSQYVSGLVTTEHTRVYISRGVGTSALRLRWDCRPEIALIHLHPRVDDPIDES